MMPKMDGGAIDPRVARVLLQLREDVADATERAMRELEDLELGDPW